MQNIVLKNECSLECSKKNPNPNPNPIFLGSGGSVMGQTLTNPNQKFSTIRMKMKFFPFLFSGEGWESERDRFKQIIEDRDSQITQLKIEGDVGRSQLGGTKKEIDELKNKLQDYEKMSKFQKAAVSDTSATAELETKLADTKKQLSNFERDHRSELNNTKMKYDGKVAVMNEEIAALKAQASKYRRLVIHILLIIPLRRLKVVILKWPIPQADSFGIGHF
jgi:hypothetical protein